MVLDVDQLHRFGRHWFGRSSGVFEFRRLLVLGLEVLDQQLPQLLGGGFLLVAQPPGVPPDSLLEQVAGEPAVAERLVAGRSRQNAPEAGLRLGGHRVVGGAGELVQDADDLGVGVVLELDDRLEPAGEAGVLGDEHDHRVGVARDDDDEVVAVVLHLLDEGVDGLLAVLVAGERVRLVDEQHPAVRLGAHLGGLDGGLAEVPGDQLGPVDLDELALGQQPERPVDPADHPGHGRLAGARVAHEDEVTGQVRALQARLAPQRVDLEHGDLLVHLPLDPLETDHRVEVGEQLLEGLGGLLRLGGGGCRPGLGLRRRLVGMPFARLGLARRRSRVPRGRASTGRRRPAGRAGGTGPAAGPGPRRLGSTRAAGPAGRGRRGAGCWVPPRPAEQRRRPRRCR